MARAPPVAAAGLKPERDGRAGHNDGRVERGRALDWTRLVLRRRRRRRHQRLEPPGPLQRPAKDRARVHSTRIEPAEVAQQVCIGREQGGEALRRRLAQLREERIIGTWRGRVVGGGAALFGFGLAALGLGLARRRGHRCRAASGGRSGQQLVARTCCSLVYVAARRAPSKKGCQLLQTRSRACGSFSFDSFTEPVRRSAWAVASEA